MIVLDTHAWIWTAAAPEKLSPAARRAIDEADRIGVCPISCWEIGALTRKGRLALDRDVLLWVKQALALPRLELIPISPQIGVAAAQLGPEFPGDSADRLIFATAMIGKAVLVTKDARLSRAKPVECVW